MEKTLQGKSKVDDLPLYVRFHFFEQVSKILNFLSFCSSYLRFTG